MDKLNRLRKNYPLFEYRSFSSRAVGDDIEIVWEMASGNLIYHPKIRIKNATGKADLLSQPEYHNLIFHLGLADMFSYWKATCSPKIVIACGQLDAWQTDWWHNLFVKGMGQYYFENHIDFRGSDFLTISSFGDSYKHDLTIGTGTLIPIGGGKDSAVTLELLAKASDHHGAVILESNLHQPAAYRLGQVAGIKEIISVTRTLDPVMLNLDCNDYLTGHVPYSAYLSFLFTFLAKLFGYSEVTLANERSSDEGNLNYLGTTINHQYSKSLDYENAFRDYNQKYLSGVDLYSFLRPLYELQIIKLFSNMANYFASFRSCNVSLKQQTDSWCGHCPKCLAVYVGLFPFVDIAVMDRIFKKRLFEDANLLDLTKNILGLGQGKPFECIGTFDETIVAFYLSYKKFGARKLPILLNFYTKSVLPKYPNIDQMVNVILHGWGNDANLPKKYSQLLKDAYTTN